MSSELIGRIKLGIADKLKNPARRRRMFVRMAQDDIAMQIRMLRELRGFKTQSGFAAHAHMQQSAVSRIENADYMGWTFKTLLKVADALDARLHVSFEPAEHVIRRFDTAEHDIDADVASVFVTEETALADEVGFYQTAYTTVEHASSSRDTGSTVSLRSDF